jgi:serine protease AprX
MMRRVFVAVCVVLALDAGRASATERASDQKLDAALRARARAAQAPGDPWTRQAQQAQQATSRVIVRTVDGKPARELIDAVNGVSGRFFAWLGGQVARVPDASLEWLASQPEIAALSLDRAVSGTLQDATVSTGARWIADRLGFEGKGVGVATIDSGVAAWHDDLEGRIAHFADFVGGQADPYDDYGHGTHVAGIIAGSGRNSDGVRRGIAPGAHLVVLKALDVGGNGYASNVIAAIDYAIAHRVTYNIRVINLSVAAGVYESYLKDPLTLAAKRAVDAGIVVVAAAGNNGRRNGDPEYGGIASPGNAPWVLTVGAANPMGTDARGDDTVAGFSSRGPSAIDRSAKPDLVAPGVGIESTADPASALFLANPASRLWGTTPTTIEPYLRLTGTSMSAPIVTAAIALMLEANPALTPNAVKAILQYTAEAHAGVDHRAQGAGFLNARGAVELARAFGNASSPWPLELTSDPVRWNRHIIWGRSRIPVAMLYSGANAWRLGVTWGDARTAGGEAIRFGVDCPPGGEACGQPGDGLGQVSEVKR